MQFVSSISRADRTSEAIEECARSIGAKLGAPDLVIAFVSRHHASRSEVVPSLLAERFGDARALGCAGWSVIGDAQEVEQGPAISLTAAKLPGVEVDARRIVDPEDVARFGADADAFLVLVDSYLTDADTLIERLDEHFPGVPKFGGFANGGVYPGTNAMFLDGETEGGSLVVSFRGNVEVDTIVAQGCRPIGEPQAVEKTRDNIILELERGRPANVLKELFESLPLEDQQLIPQALHIGLQVRARADGDYRRGDYLLRPILGIDPNSGTMTVNERMDHFDVVRFHLRDKDASTADLKEWLDEYLEEEPTDVAGALLFSCISRGVDLFGEPNHDTGMFVDRVGHVPVGGFFCNGEVGPVGDRTFLHAYTSTFAIFRPGDS